MRSSIFFVCLVGLVAFCGGSRLEALDHFAEAQFHLDSLLLDHLPNMREQVAAWQLSADNVAYNLATSDVVHEFFERTLSRGTTVLAPHLQVEEPTTLKDGGDALAGHSRRNLLAIRRDIRTSEPIGQYFCAQEDPLGQCTSDGLLEYGIYLGALFGVRLIVGLLMVIGLVVFLIGRCCCCCGGWCGGRKPGFGICCSTSGGYNPGCGYPFKPNKDEFPGYSTQHIWVIKGLIVLVVAFSIVVFSLSMAGNAGISKGVRDMLDTLFNTVDYVLEKGSYVAAALAELEFTRDAGAQLEGALVQMQDVRTQAEEVNTTVVLYDGYRQLAIMLSLIVPFALLGLGALLGLLHVSFCSIFIASIVVLILLPVWISVGVHDVLGTVISDLCVVFDAMKEEAASATNSSAAPTENVLNTVLSCASGGGEGAFATFRNVYEDGVLLAKTAMCEGLIELCNTFDTYTYTQSISGLGTYTVTVDVINCTFDASQPLGQGEGCYPEDAPNHALYSYVRDPPLEGDWYTLEECAVSCPTLTTRYLAQNITGPAEVIILYDNLFRDHILPLFSCGFVTDFVGNVTVAVCDTLATGLITVKRCQQLLAISCSVGAIILCMGGKRFDPRYHAGDYVDPHSKDFDTSDDGFSDERSSRFSSSDDDSSDSFPSSSFDSSSSSSRRSRKYKHRR